MKVTYLNHSGLLLEWDRCYWIFDYYKGELPAICTGGIGKVTLMIGTTR